MSLFNDLLTEIKKLPVTDVHSHIPHHQPQAQSPAGVLLYHVFAAELRGASMSPETCNRLQEEPTEADLAEWVKYWRLCQATTMGRAVWQTAQDLWGVSGEPTVEALSQLWQRVTAETASDPQRATAVWDRCNLKVISASRPDAPEEIAEPRLRWQLERAFWGVEPARVAIEHDDKGETTADNFEEVYAAWLASFVARGASSIGCAPPTVGATALDDAALQQALRATVSDGPLSPAEMTALHLAQVRGMLRCSHETGIPIFLTVGIEILDGWWSLALVDHTHFVNWLTVNMRTFPRARVLLASGNWSTHQCVCLAARQCRGIYATGHWWQSLFESSTAAQMEQRLDTVPMNKVIGFFSDAYCAEWVYSRLLLAQEQMARVLAEWIEAGRLSEDVALKVARCWLHDNAVEVGKHDPQP